jgi:hypothetical protein
VADEFCLVHAKESEIPPDETGSVPAKILQLADDLAKPEAQDSETKLNILTI